MGTKRIPADTPYPINDSNVIGIGWTVGVPLGKIQDSEKFIFKVVREPTASINNRITFQSDDEFENIEQKIANLDSKRRDSDSVIHEDKPILKRKMGSEDNSINLPSKTVKKEVQTCYDEQVISILSDSDTDVNIKPLNNSNKKPLLEPVLEEPQKLNNYNKNEINLKSENEYLEFEAFNVKQEYLGYDDEAIPVDSDSDSESEHWYLRLSQSSPGKPFTVLRDKSMESKPEDSSYSQMDDDLGCNAFEKEESYYVGNPASLPPQPLNTEADLPEIRINVDKTNMSIVDAEEKDYNAVTITDTNKSHRIQIAQLASPTPDMGKDEIDGSSMKEVTPLSSVTVTVNEPLIPKKAQMIEPLNHMSRRKTNQSVPESKFLSH